MVFAAGGIVLWSWRVHELTFMRTPLVTASAPRYAPHGQHAIATVTEHGSVLRPISPYPKNAIGRR